MAFGKFTLTIDIGNDAVQNEHDIADLLAKVVSKLRNGNTDDTIRDLNGNNVGSFEMELEDEDEEDFLDGENDNKQFAYSIDLLESEEEDFYSEYETNEESEAFELFTQSVFLHFDSCVEIQLMDRINLRIMLQWLNNDKISDKSLNVNNLKRYQIILIHKDGELLIVGDNNLTSVQEVFAVMQMTAEACAPENPNLFGLKVIDKQDEDSIISIWMRPLEQIKEILLPTKV